MHVPVQPCTCAGSTQLSMVDHCAYPKREHADEVEEKQKLFQNFKPAPKAWEFFLIPPRTFNIYSTLAIHHSLEKCIFSPLTIVCCFCKKCHPSNSGESVFWATKVNASSMCREFGSHLWRHKRIHKEFDLWPFDLDLALDLEKFFFFLKFFFLNFFPKFFSKKKKLTLTFGINFFYNFFYNFFCNFL